MGLEEKYTRKGTEKVIEHINDVLDEHQRWVECQPCGGHGTVDDNRGYAWTCVMCDGRGQVRDHG